MYLKKMRGFTLIELITVISIIILLVGLLSPVLRKAREQAKVQKARAMVASLEVAINMYYTDLGNYPTGFTQLIDTGDSNYGPYMDNSTNFIDPWENPYNYQQSGSHNPKTFDVWSNGPDKASGNADDIGNW